jgi:hypothetical protein
VTRRTVLAFTLAMAVYAVLAVPVRAAGPPTQLGQTTKTPPVTQSQCTYASRPSQCAGRIDVQDPALTRDRVHLTGSMELWLIWLALGGLFVAFGFRRPLLRALRAAMDQTEETAYKDPVRPSISAAPEADPAPHFAETWRGPRAIARSVDTGPTAADSKRTTRRSHRKSPG